MLPVIVVRQVRMIRTFKFLWFSVHINLLLTFSVNTTSDWNTHASSYQCRIRHCSTSSDWNLLRYLTSSPWLATPMRSTHLQLAPKALYYLVVVDIFLTFVNLDLMFVTGNDSRIVIWNLSSGEMLQEICAPSAGFISCLAWIKLADRDEEFLRVQHVRWQHSPLPMHEWASCFLFCVYYPGACRSCRILGMEPTSPPTGQCRWWQSSCLEGQPRSKYVLFVRFSLGFPLILNINPCRIFCVAPQQGGEAIVCRSVGAFPGWWIQYSSIILGERIRVHLVF